MTGVRERVDDEAFPLLDSPAAVGEHEVHTDAGEGPQDVCGLLDRHPQGLPGVELLAWCVSTSCANVFRLHVHSQLVQDQPLAGLGARAYRVAFVLVITACWLTVHSMIRAYGPRSLGPAGALSAHPR